MVVGNSRNQESKRTRGKKLRWSEKARWKAGEKGLFRRLWKKGLRRMVQEEEPEDVVMTEWMVEEQECPAEVQDVMRMMEDLRIERVCSRPWERNEHQWLEEFDVVMKDDLRTNCTSRFEHGEETKEQSNFDKLVEQVWHGDSPDEADVVAEKSIVPVKGVVGVGGVLCDQADPRRNVCR